MQRKAVEAAAWEIHPPLSVYNKSAPFIQPNIQLTPVPNHRFPLSEDAYKLFAMMTAGAKKVMFASFGFPFGILPFVTSFPVLPPTFPHHVVIFPKKQFRFPVIPLRLYDSHTGTAFYSLIYKVIELFSSSFTYQWLKNHFETR